MSQSLSTADGSLLRGILLAVLILIAIPIVLMPMMGAWGVGHMHEWLWNGTGAWWAWIVMWLFMLGILIGGGFLLYWALRTPRDSPDPALEELRTAYARGELSNEEFEERRNHLQRT